MINKFASKVYKHILNIPGWTTNRKMVVIESDDWGSIRMSSKKSYDLLLKMGYPVDKNPYNIYDCLESNKDIELLFDVLSKVKDKNQRPAIMTMNYIVANPDFDQIKRSGYSEYYYESVIETTKRYPNHDKVIELIRDGFVNGVFKPQFHGREHLNINRWMKSLKGNEKHVIDAFNLEMFSIHYSEKPTNRNEYMDALDFNSFEELKQHEEILNDGISLFKEIWGFDSKSFIANCYIWHQEHEKILKKLGVNYIQGLANQFVPIEGQDYTYKKIYHFLGQKNKFNQIYLLRNAFFEPYQKDKDWVSDCLLRIQTAFLWNKPAIISTHRVNYVGELNTSHRDKNLLQLDLLLKSIIKRWPNVEFISSDELGEIIKHDKSQYKQ